MTRRVLAESAGAAASLADRAWAHFPGRGLVKLVDDVRATSPPSHPEPLDAPAASLVETGFDHRRPIRTITASEA